MVRQPSDPHPDAAWRMIELLRQAPPARRAALALSLSKTAVDLARRALARRMPGRSALEVALAFVALHYGEELARKVRALLGAP